MTGDELTRALLTEEVASPRAVAEALFASVSGGVPLLQALVDSGAATPDILARHLSRSESPFLRQVVAVEELVERLPRGLCARLLAIPVRRDNVTGTIDVVVADTTDPHPATEIGFHLRAPVRIVRAPISAIEETLRRLRMRPPPLPHAEYDSAPPGPGGRPATLPPPEPALSFAMPEDRDVPPRRGGLVLEADSAPPPAAAATTVTRMRTPPWGTPIHARAPSEIPRSETGSDIPIPLTRKTYHPGKMAGGTQRPPGLVNPAAAGLGEGYAYDATDLRDVVERRAAPRPETSAYPRSIPMSDVESMIRDPLFRSGNPAGSFIPGPPPVPGARPQGASQQMSLPEMSGVLAALRNAGSRDEVLELVLMGARMVASKVALFVVKRGGYVGWVGTPELANRSALQAVQIPLEANSIFDRAVREDLYLGPIRYDEVHAPLLRVLRNPSRDVAAVPIRVSGKTAVVILTDDLGDTMIGTRRLEELARAAGEAFARIVRTRR